MAETMRINKYISHNTTYSRREADTLLQEGLVKVNNKVVTDMSLQVSAEDKVEIKGRYVKDKSDEMYTVIVYNKAKGELVTKSDPRGRKTIYDSLSGKFRHFLPVGRLDFASEGVILLSDNVDIVNALMHSTLERVYKLKVNGMITQKVIDAMNTGLELEDATSGAHEKTEIKGMKFAPFINYQVISSGKNYSKLKVVITEGKNRELRRFFGNFNLDILDLKRLEYGGISLNNLPTGKSRYLTREEYRDLRKYLKEQDKAKNDE